MDSIDDRIREIVRAEMQPVLEAAAHYRRESAKSAQNYTTPSLPTGSPRGRESALWLTTEEAAIRLGISRKTMENWRALGKGPEYRKLGRAIRYDATKIDEALSAPKCR